MPRRVAKNPLGSLARNNRVSFFCEKAQSNGLAKRIDLRAPLACLTVKVDAVNARCVILLHRHVFGVLSVDYIAKVGQPVVGPIAVYVVNLTAGPFAVIKRPRYTVRRKRCASAFMPER
jgi:hypothetical protein